MSEEITDQERENVGSLIHDLLEVVRDGHADIGNVYSFVNGPNGGSQVNLKPMEPAQ